MSGISWWWHEMVYGRRADTQLHRYKVPKTRITDPTAKAEQAERQAKLKRFESQRWKLWQQHTPSEDLMQKLPAELRNEIYGEVMKDGMVPALIEKGSWTEPGLLRTSKWIRLEALAMCYQRRNFYIIVRVDELNKLREWLQAMMRRRVGRSTYLCGYLRIKSCTHLDVGSLLPLACIGYHHPGFVIEDFSNHHTARAMKQVLALGEEARQQGQGEEMLGILFDQWLENMLSSREWKRVVAPMQRKAARRADRDYFNGQRESYQELWREEVGDKGIYPAYARSIRAPGDRVRSWEDYDYRGDGEFKSRYMKKAARLEPSDRKTRSMTAKSTRRRRRGKAGMDDRFV